MILSKDEFHIAMFLEEENLRKLACGTITTKNSDSQEIKNIVDCINHLDFSFEMLYNKYGLKTLFTALELANAYAKIKIQNTERSFSKISK